MRETAVLKTSLKQALLGILLCLGMSVLLFAAQAIFDPKLAYGAEISVTSSDDTGSGSLREAIDSAEATGDEIVFEFDTDTTITLASALENSSKSFTIRNGGTGAVTIVAGSGFSVFSIAGGSVSISGCALVGDGTQSVISASANTNLTLGGNDESAAVSITGGGDSGINYIGTGTLELVGNVSITNNSNDTHGGGIYMEDGTLSITQSAVIQDNTAPEGKDIYYSKNQSIVLGKPQQDSKIVIGSMYTNADPDGGTAPFLLGGEFLRASSIRVEPFAKVPSAGSVLVGKAAVGPLELENPATFSFTGLDSTHWAQFIGDNSAGYTNLEKVIVSDAPTVTCPNIDLNDIQDLVLTFSSLLHNSEAPKSLYPYYLHSGVKGSEIPPESSFGAGDGFAYSPTEGTITIPADIVAQFIAEARAPEKGDSLSACILEIEVEGSSNRISIFYADISITGGSSPGPTPEPSTPEPIIPATSDTIDIGLFLACCFAGLTFCIVSLGMSKRRANNSSKH